METSNRLLLVEEQKMDDIEKPHHHDVLCGRGVTTNRHPGNESFRSLVSLNKELYVSSTKRQKMSISRSIVEAVRSLDPPGRFLEKDLKTGLWSDIGHKKAVEKTSQALRDGAASLRKQLSADLADPDFLNAVFDMDLEESNGGDVDKRSKDAKQMGKEVEKAPSREKVNKDKVKASDKSKATKMKSAPAKKGHRRVKSTPCSGTAATSAKVHRRSQPGDIPDSPLSRLADRNPLLHMSPRSPPLRQTMSQPNSPMTWGSRISFGENESPGSLGPVPPSSPYKPSTPPTFSPHGQRSGHGSNPCAYPFDYHHQARNHHHYLPEHRPPHHNHQQQHHHQHHSMTLGSTWHYPHAPSFPRLPGHQHSPTSTRSSSESHPPSSPIPSGPLPPGRHQFSPSGYRTKPHPPEWSPRIVHRQHLSPQHYSPNQRNYPVGRSPRWRSPSPQDCPPEYTSSRCSNNSGLSVPALGGEGKYSKSSLSPRVSLIRRSGASPFAQIPPRPPTYREFNPPPPSPRFRRSSGSPGGHSLWNDRKESVQRSSPVEEKKTDLEEKMDNGGLAPFPSSAESSPSSVAIMSISNECRSSTQRVEKSEVERGMRNGTVLRVESNEEKEDELDENPAVEDIAMSPIPFDREDPTTLMELPEDILTLPISPCGPNDDPSVAASRT